MDIVNSDWMNADDPDAAMREWSEHARSSAPGIVLAMIESMLAEGVTITGPLVTFLKTNVDLQIEKANARSIATLSAARERLLAESATLQ